MQIPEEEQGENAMQTDAVQTDKVNVTTEEKTEYEVRTPRGYLFIKRAFDIFASALGLLICLIPMGIVAVVIRLESPGPAIFKQVRLGRGGKPYTMYKFRSMRQDAEKNGPQWATVNDDRCTKVGKFIRRCHIDELPQLFNVLKGDMSMVGPRPERPYFYDEFEAYIPNFRQRLKIKPGLTGLSQVNGCYDMTPEQRLAYDKTYMAARGLWTDLKILLQTVVVVFNGKGAR